MLKLNHRFLLEIFVLNCIQSICQSNRKIMKLIKIIVTLRSKLLTYFEIWFISFLIDWKNKSCFKTIFRSRNISTRMNKIRCCGLSSSSNKPKQEKQTNMYCLVCSESLFRCKCKRFRSNLDLSYKQNKHTERAFDSLLILASMILTYVLYLWSYGTVVLLMPMVGTFLIIKSRILGVFDTNLTIFALEICRFIIFNYRLIIFLIIISFVAKFVNFYTILFLVSWFILYLIAKYLNKIPPKS